MNMLCVVSYQSCQLWFHIYIYNIIYTSFLTTWCGKRWLAKPDVDETWMVQSQKWHQFCALSGLALLKKECQHQISDGQLWLRQTLQRTGVTRRVWACRDRAAEIPKNDFTCFIQITVVLCQPSMVHQTFWFGDQPLPSIAYLHIVLLDETSIYQLLWFSPGGQGFDP